ncbi:MAG: NAD-binding protein [Ignisphaera sp.]
MRVIVVGAVDEIMELIRELIDKGHEVVVLDDDNTRIDRFVQELDVAVYLFSLFDLTTFMRAGMHKADIVLVAHPVDTVNVLVCIYAKSLGVPKIYAVVGSAHTANVLSKLGFVERVLVKSTLVRRSLTELIYGVRIIELDEDNYLVMLTLSEVNHLEGKKVEEVEEQGAKILAILDSENNPINYDKDYVLKRGEKIVIKINKRSMESLLFKYR